ncbi:hypothetical protein PC9H_003101 [Pleurotus ostreatus]|uniref:Uncharacterized protein n=2 Tax=Pleurotus ostreatus TaxID=5322 RepID=A0A067P645_PLEO1|nr:uncharacterized protein PC9H_003101 [Pleurotus ostreatus]KAF7436272.1 hypothetical protein PC9H_003101 [Pleurotus ostreatus]KDQ31331.1 hypothetical protein PLEOSDRAFT_1082428 [Pleurotus ostreatus PC15]
MSYGLKETLAGNILPDHLQGGVVSGILRLKLTVLDTKDVNPDIWVFTVSNCLPHVPIPFHFVPSSGKIEYKMQTESKTPFLFKLRNALFYVADHLDLMYTSQSRLRLPP